MNSLKRIERIHKKVVSAAKELNQLQQKRINETPHFPSGGFVSSNGNCPPEFTELPRQFTINRDGHGEYVIPSEPSEVRKLKNKMYDRIINER